MKTILHLCLLGLCIAFDSAHAIVEEVDVNGVLLQVENGILIGAKHVPVDTMHYDVQFVDGACVALFSGCDETQDFLPFSTFPAASSAAQALVDTVFLDVPSHSFDSLPSLTRGCTGNRCNVAIPNSLLFLATGTFVHTDVAINVEPMSPFGFDDMADIADFPVNEDLTFDDQSVFSIWVPSAIPEPGPAAWLGVGLLALVLVQRRRTLLRGRAQ